MRSGLKLSCATVTKLHEDVICIEYHPDAHVDIPELNEALRAYTELMGDKKFYLLTIVNEGVTHSIEARKVWLKKKRSSFKLAEAFVINNLPHRLIANFVLRVTPPRHKAQYFPNEYRALAWLLKQKQTKN